MAFGRGQWHRGRRRRRSGGPANRARGRAGRGQVGYKTAVSVDVFDRRLILVVGKGGVGRSTVAAAIADQCARRGRKTLLFEVNANDRFGTYFDKPAVGPEITPLAPNLWAVNTNPATAL